LADAEVVTRDDLEQFRQSDNELAFRRQKVLKLRARRVSEAQIGRALGVSEATVSRDLAWIREHWRELFGPTPTFDPAAFVGETLSRYEEIEAIALVDAAKANGLRERMACFHVAMLARDRQVSLLQDLGLLRHMSDTPVRGLPTAAQIRAALQTATIDPADPAVAPPETA
jgi:predicted transcriptional regulator